MPAELRFTVLTPSGPLVRDPEASKVRVRLVGGGLLSVYPYHAPLMAETMTGEVLYVSKGSEERLQLNGGIFFVCENTVTLYTSGRVGGESDQAGVGNEREGMERFDRLTEVLLSTLQAHPQRFPDEVGTDDLGSNQESHE